MLFAVDRKVSSLSKNIDAARETDARSLVLAENIGFLSPDPHSILEIVVNGVFKGGEPAGTLPSFLAVDCAVRATTLTNRILMLGSCLLWEIFRMIPSTFCARKNLDKWYNLGAVVILIPLVSYSLLFML